MSPDPSPESPLRIGRYVLLGRLGRGGMGEVHRARAFGAAGVTKDVCIKRIRKSRLAHEGALPRFVAEARLWMRLSHANIVQVFDFGRIENDYYLAMEWVDGCDLRALLDDAEATCRPLEEEEALFVAAELTRALSYLHEAEGPDGRSVAHCDLKPSNVLLSRKSEVKLADFGVAVAAGSSRAGGTRGYIPPSESGRVGAAADLYALGRVFAEIAARTRPCPGAEQLNLLAGELGTENDARTARQLERELEAALARTRVRSDRSPRDLLSARVADVPLSVLKAENESVRTDASFLASEDEQVFMERMRAPSSMSTSSRAGPPPIAARRSVWPWIAGALAAVLAVVVWSSADVREPPPRERATPTVGAGLTAPAEAEPTPIVAPTSALEEPTPTAAPADPSITPSDEAAAPSARGLAGGRTRPATEARAGGAEPPPAEPPPSTGHLRINALPWAEVFIDGAAAGTTPLADVALSPGTHVVRLVHPASGRETSRTVVVTPNEREDLIADLR